MIAKQKQKKIEALTGEELIHKVKELGNLSREAKAKICGYYSVTKNGLERINMMQFLRALIDAEGIELDAADKANERNERSVSHPTTAQANGSMNSNKIIAVKRANQPPAKPQLPSQVQQPETELVQPIEIMQSEQPVSVSPLESLVEFTKEESVYGSGWSLAQLMNEFGGR